MATARCKSKLFSRECLGLGGTSERPGRFVCRHAFPHTITKACIEKSCSACSPEDLRGHVTMVNLKEKCRGEN